MPNPMTPSFRFYKWGNRIYKEVKFLVQGHEIASHEEKGTGFESYPKESDAEAQDPSHLVYEYI